MSEKIEKIINKIKRMIKKKDTIKTLAIHDKDVGSTEIQMGLLTDKITKLSEHFKIQKDKHSTLGLTKSVNKEKNFLHTLKEKCCVLSKGHQTIKFKEIMFKYIKKN